MKLAGVARGAEGRLAGQSEARLDDVLDVGRGKPELAAGFLELLGERLELFAELALELGILRTGSEIAFGAAGVEVSRRRPSMASPTC